MRELGQATGPVVLLVGDDSRIARNERDGLDLLDAARVSGASVVAPDEEGSARWILTNGGDPAEVAAFKDRIIDARKSSDELAAKLRRGRRRWAGRSYHGGMRPFGYRTENDTVQHARNLTIDEAEATLIRKTRDDLFSGLSLRAVTRAMRGSGIPTVSEQRAREEGRPGTGAEWTSIVVRTMLLNAAVVGQQVRNGQRVDAPWPEIITEDDQARLRIIFDDPARQTNGGNTPRWLLSGFATCGVCGKLLVVNGSTPGYRNQECGHVSRNAAKVDSLISDLVIDWLEKYGDSERLRPAPRPDVDVWALRAELRRLADRREKFRKAGALGDMEPADVTATLRDFDAEMLKVQDKIVAAHDGPDPLGGFRDGNARAAWEAAPVARRRQLVQTLFRSIKIQPATRRGGRGFDPTKIECEWQPRADSPRG